MEVTTFEIKEEGVEDDEMVDEENPDVGSSRDESTDLKLMSMRCQDCGQQFTRWEAFKVHLRMHVLEEEDAKPKAKRKAKYVPQKRQKMSPGANTEQDVQSSDVDVDGVDDDHEDDIFDSSWQPKPAEITKVRPRVATPSEEQKPVLDNNEPVYACTICGKVYSYLVAFRNHQKMHENESSSKRSIKKHQEHKCPDCGKSFVRPSLLLAHLKVHRTAFPAEPNLRCEQCNRSFNSLQTWVVHMELHKQKPYWCLTCSKGFKDEMLLEKHMGTHNQKRHQCDVCFKCFRVPAELRYHMNVHTGDKPHKCGICKMNFSQLSSLNTHRKKHTGVHVGASKTPLGNKKMEYANGTQKKEKVVTEMKKLVFDGNKAVVIERGNEAAVPVSSSSEESGSESSESKFEDSFESSAPEEEHQDTKKMVAGKSNMADHGRQDDEEEDWDCFECGMRFDQEGELHQHYMKHASGQLTIP